MTDLKVLRASYKRYPMEFADAGLSPDDRFERLAEIIAGELETTFEGLPRDAVGQHYFSSTILDHAFSWRRSAAHDLLKLVSHKTKHVPDVVLNAYECAGWGFAIRHALRTDMSRKPIACTIVDLNLFDFGFWRRSEHWGNSGFGVSTLLLEPIVEDETSIVTGRAKTANMLAEFAMAVRASVDENHLVALPFFPKHVSDMFDRTLPKISRLPDRHAELGHCFGSDPWVLLLTHSGTLTPNQSATVRLCSVALNGYWALADVEVSPASQLRLELG